MTGPIENADELLAHVAAGRLDDLTPAQVAALDAHLHAHPTAAQRLANVVPAPDSRLAGAIPAPTETQWDQAWKRIESATPTRLPLPRETHRVFRLWRTVADVAACLLLVVLWRSSVSPSDAAWEMRLSDDVVVHELEVFGDASAFVAYAEDGSGTATIWVFEDGAEPEGA
jgi:hypothetical protein